ncbi:MAG: ABC transporter permease [Blastocatellia bacterium]|nr:ABC transporter permease [Blastocatellia bacterium]
MKWRQRLFRRRKQEEELEKELRFHLDQHTADLIARGLDPEEARRRARLALGGPEQVKERCRDARGTRWLEDLAQDLRYGLRMLMKNPGFTLIAVITLAAGIAANTTIFSVADALVLRPFNFPNQERLVMVWERTPTDDHSWVIAGDFNDYRELNRSFEWLIAFDQRDFDMAGTSPLEQFGGYGVSAYFFDALGVKAALGRTFLPGEDEPGRDQVVVLKHSLWERRFGADPNIVGRTLTFNGKPFTVIGVAPPDFNFPFNGGEIWTPLAFDEKAKHERGHQDSQVFGLLKPGVSVAQANADLYAISLRAQRLFPETNAGRSVNVIGMNEYYARDAKPYVTPLAGAVALVLLIACANVANMLSSRAFGRQKEIAVRLALGASRWRLIRQLLTESLILALAGGVIGLLSSVWAVNLLRTAMPKDYEYLVPGLNHFGVNRNVLLFTLIISMLTGVVFGLMPALQTSKPNLNEFLKEGAKGASSSGSRQRLRGALVVAEVALSLVLLIGAGLMIRSFVAMMRDDMGFNPRNALSFRLFPPKERYSEARRRDFYDQLIKRLESMPGVVAAGGVNVLPMSNNYIDTPFEIVGRPPSEKGKEPFAAIRIVTPGYFSAIGIPLRRGRGFTDKDNELAQRVVIVNEALARRYFPNQEVIGQRIMRHGFEDKPMEIVGVVGDAKDTDLDRVPMPGFYFPYAQDPLPGIGVVLRAEGEPTALSSAARAEVAKLDPAMPVYIIKTVEQMIHETSSPKRNVTALMGVFAGIALLLTAVGLYAVIAYAVSQRIHEIGVRLALGARSHDIIRLVIWQGLKLTLVGLALGMAGAFVLTRVMAPLLYGVTATDPLTFILISLALAGVALAACWIPARQATKVDPMIALRRE